MIRDKINDQSSNKLSLIITHDNTIKNYFDTIINIGVI